jgi:tetratricopeptide (TPR) repeat protein
VQLIRAANDSHLWAETFDRKLTDIFSVESEVAKAIADQLRAKLTGQEEEVIAARPTNNPEAYDAYLRGLAYTLRTGNSPGNTLGAQKYLKEAVRLDPKFALAWALLSYVDALGYLTLLCNQRMPSAKRPGMQADTALTLQPNLGEAILAKGYYYYACLKDNDAAVRYFEQARQFLPNSSQIPESLAYVARRRGQWDRSESYFNEAERLDPRNVSLLTQHAQSYMLLRRFPKRCESLIRCSMLYRTTWIPLRRRRVLHKRRATFRGLLRSSLRSSARRRHGRLEIQVYQAILERRPAQMISRLKEILAKPDPALGYNNGELRFWLGWAQEVAGDHAAAQESCRQAVANWNRSSKNSRITMSSLEISRWSIWALVIKPRVGSCEQAMTVLPLEKDVVDGPAPIEILARVAAQLGEPTAPSPRYKTVIDTFRGRTGFARAAHSCAAPARSDVRSSPKRSALPGVDQSNLSQISP